MQRKFDAPFSLGVVNVTIEVRGEKTNKRGFSKALDRVTAEALGCTGTLIEALGSLTATANHFDRPDQTLGCTLTSRTAGCETSVTVSYALIKRLPAAKVNALTSSIYSTMLAKLTELIEPTPVPSMHPLGGLLDEILNGDLEVMHLGGPTGSHIHLGIADSDVH